LTEAFDVETKKGEIDYDNISKITSELLAYLKSDCIGLWQVLESFYSTDFIAESGAAVTIASQAMRVMQTYLKFPLYSCPERVDRFVRRGYFGGRTEIFRPIFLGDEANQIYCYDVNSLYPAQMYELEFPNRFKKWTRRMGDSALGFYEATVYVPESTYMPILPVVFRGSGARKDKKLIFPTGMIRGVWSSLELRYAEECGATIQRIHKGAEFRNGGRVFRDFVGSLYKIRCESPKDSVQNYVAKLILNSSYGKLAIRRVKENILSVEHEDDFYNSEPWRNIQCGKTEIQLVKQSTELKGFSNVAMGAWVTAGGRVHMHRLMTPIQDSIYYMDTDSVFTTRKLPSGSGLGELKFEYARKRACFLLPKTYITEDLEGKCKATMKGFDKKKIEKFTFDDFHSTLNGEMGLLKIEGQPKFAKFKTATRKGNLLIMVDQGKKQIRSRYDKRILFKDDDGGERAPWNTRPIEVQMALKKKTKKPVKKSKSTKPQYRVVCPRENEETEETFWAQIGSGWKAKDGAISIRLNALPIGEKVMLFRNDEEEGSDEEE
jgi:hypothetical protein